MDIVLTIAKLNAETRNRCRLLAEAKPIRGGITYTADAQMLIR